MPYEFDRIRNTRYSSLIRCTDSQLQTATPPATLLHAVCTPDQFRTAPYRAPAFRQNAEFMASFGNATIFTPHASILHPANMSNARIIQDKARPILLITEAAIILPQSASTISVFRLVATENLFPKWVPISQRMVGSVLMAERAVKLGTPDFCKPKGRSEKLRCDD
jgi:hypothetical protein